MLRRIALCFALTAIWLSAAAWGNVPESKTVSYLVLMLDGAVVGPVDSFQLGMQDPRLLVDKAGLSRDMDGLQGPVEITVMAGAGMGKPMYDWIKASVNPGGSGARKNGALISADFNHKELSRLEFQNALLEEVVFPALDASAKDAAKMSIKIKPETIDRSFAHKGSALDQGNQKAWLPANFKLNLRGMDMTGAVSQVSPLVLTNATLDRPPVRLISCTIGPPLKATFDDRKTGLYCSGAPQEAGEADGVVSYLADDGSTLFTVALTGVGVTKITADPAPPGTAGTYSVELYADEDAAFDAPSAGP